MLHQSGSCWDVWHRKFKMRCKVTEEGFQTAWSNACKTRELCDEAILARHLSIVLFAALLIHKISRRFLMFLHF